MTTALSFELFSFFFFLDHLLYLIHLYLVTWSYLICHPSHMVVSSFLRSCHIWEQHTLTVVNSFCNIQRKGVISRKTLIITLFKLSPHQGLQSPWLPASFTDSLGLLLHRSNVKATACLLSRVVSRQSEV